ncbi:MAG: DNA polymerase III subunit epsilon [Acidisphaera sp.]|nr:DNA polymerase III subunit epsilon [Acidisphaera sp.]
MSRSVLFDTETTGLDPGSGDRVIEIAALELVNDLPSGRQFHALLDPGRHIHEDAARVHGYTLADLRGKPRFEEVVYDLLGFLGDGRLVAHNAPFDFAFLDLELSLLGLPRLDPARMVCTLELARGRFPGVPNSLDALCRRFGIDLSARTTHNALLDCRLLAEVYVELTGGRQRGLSLGLAAQAGLPTFVYRPGGPRVARPICPSVAELAAHTAFVGRLRDPLWAC